MESKCHHFYQLNHHWFLHPRPLHTTKNTIVVPRYDNGQILIWQNNTAGNPTSPIPASLSSPYSVFVSSDEHIFAENDATNGQVDRWTLNGTRLSSIFFHCSRCGGLFVDVNNHLYCSAYDRHQVLRQSLTDPSSVLTIVAGTGCQGSTAEMFNYPNGIFVTIDLNGPTGVVVDGDEYLFIVDSENNRLFGSDRNGFRCLFGCSTVSGAGSNQLNYPRTRSFDMDGNIFVTDENNNQIQKFVLVNDSCGKEKMREREREKELVCLSRLFERCFDTDEKKVFLLSFLSSRRRRFLFKER